MEFWGVEVKSGKPLKVQPEFGKLIHISQAALGEVKDVKGAKHVPLRLKIDDKDFIIGSLAAEDRTQLMFDLVFEKEFELSHDWKNGSVYFIGYIADDPVSDGEDYSDLSEGDSEDESEDEHVEAHKNCNHGHKPVAKVKTEVAAKVKTEVAADVATKAAAPAKAGAKKVEQPDSDDEVDSDFGSSDDEMLPGEEDDSSDLSGEGSEEGDESEEEEELPKQSKKRPAEAAQKTPVPSKKAKSATPDKTGNKKGHTATPFPSKAAGKTPAGSAKSNGQTPKSGSQLTCQSCTKNFTSQNALLSHSKAKHGGK